MKKNINYTSIPEFEKDFKKLEKRFKTLNKDFELMKRMLLEPYYLQNIQIASNALVDIEGYCGENYKSQKVRKFACAALKGRGSRSGLRVILVYEPENIKITFIEIYFKGDKQNEDKARLSNYIIKLESSK